MRIGIDIDDTICDSWLSIAPTMCKDFKLNYDEVIKSKKIYNNISNITEEEYRRYSPKFKELLKNVKLKKNAKKTINKLSKENKIIFITARSNHSYDDAYLYTKKFLKKNNIHYDKIIINGKDKKRICKEEKIDIFIDDDKNNCEDVSTLDIRVIMFENYFNEDEKRFEKLKNWKELLNIVKEEKNARKITD